MQSQVKGAKDVTTTLLSEQPTPHDLTVKKAGLKDGALKDSENIMNKYRNDAQEGQEKSRGEILRTTRSKLFHLKVDDDVIAAISVFDCRCHL